MRRLLVTLLMVLLTLSVNPVIGPSSGAAYSDPPAVAPEEVGLASSRLAHIRTVINRHVAEKQIPGAAGLIARRGKIAYQEAGMMGSPGEYNWGGAAGTRFWIDPQEELIGIFMIQILPHTGLEYGSEFRVLAYQAIAD